MNIKQILKEQGWKEREERGVSVYEFEKDVDTIKIYFTEDGKNDIKELKNKLWNAYYSRILICKNFSNDYMIWGNDQSPDYQGKSLNAKKFDFDENISPIEYWNRYITKTTAKRSKTIVRTIRAFHVSTVIKNISG